MFPRATPECDGRQGRSGSYRGAERSTAQHGAAQWRLTALTHAAAAEEPAAMADCWWQQGLTLTDPLTIQGTWLQ
jgi:hypothetical protein